MQCLYPDVSWGTCTANLPHPPILLLVAQTMATLFPPFPWAALACLPSPRAMSSEAVGTARVCLAVRHRCCVPARAAPAILLPGVPREAPGFNAA